jgi:ATP-dependent DNA helicase RecG
MRPDILNPLFAEVETLKGVGKALAKPLGRLKLEHLVDVCFHLPASWIERRRVESVSAADAGQVVTMIVNVEAYKAGGPRSPLRVAVTDSEGNPLSLVYFNNPSWAKKLLPLNESRVISGRLELYGEALQMVHPDHVVKLDALEEIPQVEPVYALSEGLTNR